MKRPSRILAAALMAALAACLAFGQAGLADGLYARISTDKGEILVSLDFQRAPLTAGNFAGLATGSLDATKGKPFYDGLAFHRVVPNFVIQGGDPAGNGSGGPGYRFADEFHPELRHSGPGVLSMANAGPGTNGSQFFITLAQTPWLDDKHSVFGKVVSGMDVVRKIAQGDKMLKVEILRVGAAAKAFRLDQAAWNQRLAQAADNARKLGSARREADLAAIAKKWPALQKGADGIYFQVLTQGTGDPAPKGSRVSVAYKGMFIDGRVFDQSSLHGGPLELKIGVGEVIEGWDRSLLLMRKGEKRLVVLPPELAYGEAGAGGVIPPNAFLVFEMELVDIKR